MILIVNPHGMKQGPYFDLPTNLLYLGASLREAGIPWSLADGNLIGNDGVKAAIDRLKPDIVGVSCLSPVRFSALDILEYARGAGATTVMGGHHGHWMHEQVLSYPFVDAVVFGEGDRAIVDLATKPLAEVEGIAYREGTDIIQTPRRQYVDDLDSLPFPAWDEIDFNVYRHTKRSIGPRTFYSRGCRGKCKFCNSTKFWRGYRHRSPANFCDELEWLFELGEQEFVFGDDNVDEDGIIQLFTEMASRDRISRPSSVTMRVDGITDESCRLMKACGVNVVCLGVESGSQRMIDHMQKGITVERAEEACHTVKQHGMDVVVLLIRNSISETQADKRASDEFCGRAKPHSVGSVNALWLYPGTAYYKEIQEGKYPCSGRELVGDHFFSDPRYAQHVIAYQDGRVFPMKVTEEG